MITLLTGLPGNGKTLFALWYVKQKADKETREVYYHNIRDLTLPWTPFDPEKWMDLPYGSLIVIDEAQDVFPKKPNGSKLPDFYSELAKHRHKGFDIFLITQHPTLLDNFPRQLVGQHFHSVRKFGMARSTIYEWSSANPSPQSASSQKTAIPIKWAYPKEVFTWYKSAEVHTVKRAIPAKLILACLFIVGMIALVYFALDYYQARARGETGGNKTPAMQTGQGQVPVNAVASGGSVAGRPNPVTDPVGDAKAFLAMQNPRVEGLAFTAPKYDQITVPVRAPVPAMCIQVGSVRSQKEVSCKCFSQQATRLDVPFNMCIEFARNGYFREFDADRDSKQSERTQQSVQALSGVRDSGPMVLALADVAQAPVRAPAPPPAPREERHADVPGPGGVYVR